jgi:F-type H+-transporting ATPase subunit delta
MAEISTIARPYAQALYAVASREDLKSWSETVDAMGALASHPDMVAAIGNPKLSEGQLYEVFTGVLKRELSAHAQNLVRTLISNGRLALLPEIAAQFHELKNRGAGNADAQIFSAFPMSDDELKHLVVDLEKRFKVRLTPSVIIDKSLIGGVRVVVGDEVLDNSIHARLEEMRVALSA